MTDNNRPAFYPSRPEIAVNGQINAGLTDGLLALVVEETTAGLYRCEATFGNWGSVGGSTDYLYFDRAVLDFGKKLTVTLGAGDARGQVFEGRMMGFEAQYPALRQPEITVLAEDRLQDLRMTRRTRTFEQMGDGEVMQHIAAQHSLRPEIDVNGPTYGVLAQLNQSDLAFLRERARAIDAEVWVEGDTLFAAGRGQRDAGSVTLTYGRELREFSALADLANQRTSVHVSGWDVSAKDKIDFEATESAIQGELNGSQSGSSLLQRALGLRAESLVHTVPLTGREAQSVAEAQFRSMARRFITGQGICEGDARVRVGAYVELRGLGGWFDGRYYVTEVQHTFDLAEGCLTRFAVERPGLG